MPTCIPLSFLSLGVYCLVVACRWTFPIIYFAAILGVLPEAPTEMLWAFFDWLTKMVYASSIMEANVSAVLGYAILMLCP